jgi:hypothetical protein
LPAGHGDLAQYRTGIADAGGDIECHLYDDAAAPAA